VLHPIVKQDLSVITASNLPWEKFRNKTVLISGVNGFLPAYMAFSLLELNDKFSLNIHVIGLARNKEKVEIKFRDALQRDDFEILVQDVCSSIQIDSKVDYIIHAASQASPKYYGIDPVGTLNANVIGTNNLLELARKNSVDGFLFFSTSEAYGSLPENKIPARENEYGTVDPTNVRACYAESKRLGETMCVCWQHQYEIPVKIVRPFHTYGPGMQLDDGRVYADFIADIVEGRNIVMKSDGSAMRAFCYLSDATLGFFTVLLKGEGGQAYNIGNPEQECSIIDLADTLVNLFPEKKLKVIRSENKMPASYLKSIVSRISPDITKANELGWNPTVSITDGFFRTIKSYV
jgi:UDP-glucuronate decarboxylase